MGMPLLGDSGCNRGLPVGAYDHPGPGKARLATLRLPHLPLPSVLTHNP